MPWNAKPYNGYALGTQEANENVLMLNGFMNQYGFTLESQAGLIACIANEGGLNPWRWGGDYAGYEAMTGDPNNSAQGYGLFQFTPWGKYVDNPEAEVLEGYGPNKSVHEVTEGANINDGWAQMLFYNNRPQDWDANCWRWYWSPENEWVRQQGFEPLSYEEYAYYHDYVWAGMMERWSNGTDLISKARFKEITYIEDAVMAFLGGYEGPIVPRYYDYAVSLARGDYIWGVISNDTPPDPPSGGGKRKKMPLWMYLRRY